MTRHVKRKFIAMIQNIQIIQTIAVLVIQLMFAHVILFAHATRCVLPTVHPVAAVPIGIRIKHIQ